jgi:hypothetical protein
MKFKEYLQDSYLIEKKISLTGFERMDFKKIAKQIKEFGGVVFYPEYDILKTTNSLKNKGLITMKKQIDKKRMDRGEGKFMEFKIKLTDLGELASEVLGI